MLVKILKQLVITICLVSILFSSPAVALASQNIEAHVPKGGSNNISDKSHNGDSYTAGHDINITNNHDDSNFSLGAVAGAILGGLSSVSLVSVAGSITGLSAAGISTGLATVGGIVGGGMAVGLVVSAALPVAGVAGGLLAVKGIEHLLKHHHEQENNRSNA